MLGILLAVELIVEPGGLTMDGALAKIRAARQAGDELPAAVTVRGLNRLTAPVAFTDADHDIDFIGENGATISGGRPLTGWREIESGVWETEAPRGADGRTEFFDQLWVNGRRASCARLPSEGWLGIASACQLTNQTGRLKFTDCVTFDDDRVRKLADVPREDWPYLEAGVICKWSYGLRTLDGYDAAKNAVEFQTDFPWQRWKIWDRRGVLIAFFNVRSAFDAPGEWFLDMTAGKVRYRPLPGEEMASADVVAANPSVTRLLTFKGDWRKRRLVRNIRFRNIAFAHAAAETEGGRPKQLNQWQAGCLMDGAIALEGVRGIVFDRCDISRTAGYGFRFHSACMSNRVTNCRITDPGTGGLWLGADLPKTPAPDIVRQVLKPDRLDSTGFNIISNNVISGGGRYNPEGVGVCLSHCSDTKIIHNDIHDFYYSGVSIGWVWGFAGSVSQRNEVGFNRIWDLGKKVMSDMGGVYSLGTSFGTTVHDNVIHDVWSHSYGGWALYCDEGSEGIVEERNLCWNTTDGGFHQHFGVGCIIRNNIFAFNRELGTVRTKRAVVFGVPCSLHFVNNIIYVREGPLVGEGVRNVGGVWANNLWYDERGLAAAKFDGLSWDEWVKSGKETGGRFADPLFTDPDRFDFTLRRGSPALTLGFKPFDSSTAGATIEPLIRPQGTRPEAH